MAKSRTEGWKWEKGLAYGKGRKHTGELVWELQDAAQASKIFGCSIQILVSPDTRPWTVEASSQRTWQVRANIWKIAGTLQMMQISRPCHVCFSFFVKTIVRPFCKPQHKHSTDYTSWPKHIKHNLATSYYCPAMNQKIKKKNKKNLLSNRPITPHSHPLELFQDFFDPCVHHAHCLCTVLAGSLLQLLLFPLLTYQPWPKTGKNRQNGPRQHKGNHE